MTKNIWLFPQKLLTILKRDQLLKKKKSFQINSEATNYIIAKYNNFKVSLPFQFHHISHGEHPILDKNTPSDKICLPNLEMEDTQDKPPLYYDRENGELRSIPFLVSQNPKILQAFVHFVLQN